jgi:hypothetical protein
MTLCLSRGTWAQGYSNAPAAGENIMVSPNRLEENLANWVQGSIVLVTGDTVPCKMNYNPLVTEGLLQVKDEGNILTLSVREVKAFSYFDLEENKTRRFYTLPVHSEDISKTREYFLEHIYENPAIAILRHHTVQLRNYPYDPITHVLPVEYNFLLNVHTGELRDFNEKEALALMENKEDKVRAFMKTNNIKLRKDVKDYILVFNYYASL